MVHKKSYKTGRYLVIKLHKQGIPPPLIQRIMAVHGYHKRIGDIGHMIKSLEEDKESAYNKSQKMTMLTPITPRTQRLLAKFGGKEFHE